VLVELGLLALDQLLDALARDLHRRFDGHGYPVPRVGIGRAALARPRRRRRPEG
jgi:hypothetical protein